MAGDQDNNLDASKAYAEIAGSVAGAIESLLRHNGWELFMALYERRKREIRDKDDYPTLADFKADRGALEIVDGLIDEMKGYIEDGEAAVAAYQALGRQPAGPTRSVLMLEELDGDNREG